MARTRRRRFHGVARCPSPLREVRKPLNSDIVMLASNHASLLEKRASECLAIRDRLAQLLDRPWHDMMVPFGGLAYLPGRMVDVNSLMVCLGNNYFVEKSSTRAQEVLERRATKLKNIAMAIRIEAGPLGDMAEEVKNITVCRPNVLMHGSTELIKTEDGFVDIREPISDAEDEEMKISESALLVTDDVRPRGNSELEDEEFTKFWKGISDYNRPMLNESEKHGITRIQSSQMVEFVPSQPKQVKPAAEAETLLSTAPSDDTDLSSDVVERRNPVITETSQSSRHSGHGNRRLSRFKAARQQSQT